MGRKTGPETGGNQTDMGGLHDENRDVRDISRPALARVSTQNAMTAAQTEGASWEPLCHNSSSALAVLGTEL